MPLKKQLIQGKGVKVDFKQNFVKPNSLILVGTKDPPLKANCFILNKKNYHPLYFAMKFTMKIQEKIN